LLNEAYKNLDGVHNEEAYHQAKLFQAKNSNDPEFFLLMTEIAESNEQYEKALEWLNKGLKNHPHHLAILVKKASLLMDIYEEVDEAYDLLQPIHEVNTEEKLDYLIKNYDKSLVLDGYLLLIDLTRLKSCYQKALNYALIAKNIIPSDEFAILAIATAYYEVGDYDLALSFIESPENKTLAADFFHLLALIYCAQEQFAEADKYFSLSQKCQGSVYHLPKRLSAEDFTKTYQQSIITLPSEIRTLIEGFKLIIKDIIPISLIKASQAKLPPHACILITSNNDAYLFQKNIENLSIKEEDIRDIIASALLHEVQRMMVG
jgi:predicted Zn-dependent protease